VEFKRLDFGIGSVSGTDETENMIDAYVDNVSEDDSHMSDSVDSAVLPRFRRLVLPGVSNDSKSFDGSNNSEDNVASDASILGSRNDGSVVNDCSVNGSFAADLMDEDFGSGSSDVSCADVVENDSLVSDSGNSVDSGICVNTGLGDGAANVVGGSFSGVGGVSSGEVLHSVDNVVDKSVDNVVMDSSGSCAGSGVRGSLLGDDVSVMCQTSGAVMRGEENAVGSVTDSGHDASFGMSSAVENTYDDGDVGVDGFGVLLGGLLSDDETDESSPVTVDDTGRERVGEGAPGVGVHRNESVGGREKSVTGGSSSVGVSSGSSDTDVLDAREELVDVLVEGASLGAEERERGLGFAAEVREERKRAVRERRLEREAAEASVVPPPVQFSVTGKPITRGKGSRSVTSEFKRRDVREVTVDGAGRERVGEGAPGVGVHRNESVGGREKTEVVRGAVRMNVRELGFFRNLSSTKSGVLNDESLVRALRGPVSGKESAGERRERLRLHGQGLRGRRVFERGSRLRFSGRDREVLRFLAMFRYATDSQLSRMFSVVPRTMLNRLLKLRKQGLVIDRKMYGARPIWFLTEAGLLLSGLDLPRVTESKLTFSMFPHQFTVNHVAANLWGANVNVLGLKDFPAKNRVDGQGVVTFGEELVSELEIQSSFGKIKMFDKAEVYRPGLLKSIANEFQVWEESGGVSFGPSPEMVLGNEYMWALMPPTIVGLAYHVPDLVVKRERAADGSPRSIAVEVEINNKPTHNYEKTLRAYRDDMRLYEKVVWVCKNIGPARKLENIAKEIGLWQEGRIEILPIVTADGVFKERDLWTI
jgi:hypothetical protein